MAPPAPSRLQRYATVIGRAVLTAILAFLLAEFAGRLISDDLLPTSYTALVQVQTSPLGANANLGSNFDYDGYFASEKTNLESDQVLAPVVQDLGLWEKGVTRFDHNDEHSALPPNEALDRFKQNLIIQRIPGTTIMTISVSSNKAIEAAAAANAVADRYETLRNNEETPRQIRPVHILSRAEVPQYPNHHIAHMMTHLVAIIFAVIAASFLEMVMLFHRADQRDES